MIFKNNLITLYPDSTMLMQGVNGTVTTFGGGGERYSDYLNRFLSGIFLFLKSQVPYASFLMSHG